ncbi:2-succinyl-5-enolpyruvyl-6-hydroxy-3-cyclohexene-1-carboxylic-acid synthase [Psychromonas sp. psych-6C06]|uniref:2-succinyl-5-enolpyruvyl-6-hydroxy-3- cyclohexene-1-carboxylic-acid synthase n=1 Tax=Psychromonas sp. psych-6C06 TaxID=2058089 RepID=UPI000C322C75|nr:2-succinyl-5-enolpyruvyl-6-hydroxy-3-cyclohexene-1-carboxylic-acid synthase [Psychromonas sp. psych-6C06]PKF61653.1 2-succinyl-5-enolpyruvyl-6-hydroxy-3-cyclohexene-1-carboxylic-acid synthase [Psychromonas sp. psych-6C06]
MQDLQPFTTSHSNINQLWASLLVEELIRHKITDFCIAPGSRSTPLTLAIANHPKAKEYLHFDERGLGFLALGLSQASQKPVVLVTTSGTAVANLYPAVIEARQSAIPLIVLSADRPVSLLNCGANQAIDQHGIFAQYPIFFTQIVQPSTEVSPNYLLTTLDHGLNLQRNTPAPIHLNIAFAEPLYPSQSCIEYQPYLRNVSKWIENNQPFTTFITANNDRLSRSEELNDKKIIVVLGKMHCSQQAQAVSAFCQQHDLLLLADIQSSQAAYPANLHYYDLFLLNPTFKGLLEQADLIVQFGEQLLSKRLSNFISDADGELWLVNASETRIDPNHQLDKRFNCHASDWINKQQYSPSVKNKAWYQSLHVCHKTLAKQVITPFLTAQPYSEMTVINTLDHLLPDNSSLFIGNSMPIRLADMLMKENQSTIYTNRGASGIDGLLASAVGVAHNSNKITTLLLGDTSLLYDLNSLALLKSLTMPFIVIVINNDGGSIFNLLPVPEKQKNRFYQLPHGLNFKSSCEQFSIDYYNPNQLIDFQETYNRCLQGKHSLIEVTLLNQQSATQLDQLKEQIEHATL